MFTLRPCGFFIFYVFFTLKNSTVHKTGLPPPSPPSGNTLRRRRRCPSPVLCSDPSSPHLWFPLSFTLCAPMVSTHKTILLFFRMLMGWKCFLGKILYHKHRSFIPQNPILSSAFFSFFILRQKHSNRRPTVFIPGGYILNHPPNTPRPFQHRGTQGAGSPLLHDRRHFPPASHSIELAPDFFPKACSGAWSNLHSHYFTNSKFAMKRTLFLHRGGVLFLVQRPSSIFKKLLVSCGATRRISNIFFLNLCHPSELLSLKSPNKDQQCPQFLIKSSSTTNIFIFIL